MAQWEFGERAFKAPASSDRQKMKCRVCKEPLGSKKYVLALREGEGPVDEEKDVARVHEECVPNG